MQASDLERDLRARGFDVSIVSFRVHGNKYVEVTLRGEKTTFCETQMQLIREWVERQTVDAEIGEQRLHHES